MTPKPAKKPARPIYFTVRKVRDPDTGEWIGALVPSTKWDAKALRDRKCKVGQLIRAVLTKPRNVKLHRLGHVLPQFIKDRVPGFEDVSTHEALKIMQRECGAYCEVSEYTADSGEKFRVTQARSIAFDEMEDDEFADLLKQIGRHIAEKYLPHMTSEEIEAALEMMVME